MHKCMDVCGVYVDDVNEGARIVRPFPLRPPHNNQHTTYTHASPPDTSRKLGYIKLREFNSRAKKKVQAAVAELEKQGASVFGLMDGWMGGSMVSVPLVLPHTCPPSSFTPTNPNPNPKTKTTTTTNATTGAEEYVLDLRGNPGGSVQAAVEVASVFLDGEKVVTYIQVRGLGALGMGCVGGGVAECVWWAGGVRVVCVG